MEHHGAVNREKNEEKHLRKAGRNDEETGDVKAYISPAISNELISTEGALRITYRVVFLTGPPPEMSVDCPPPNLPGLAPP